MNHEFRIFIRKVAWCLEGDHYHKTADNRKLSALWQRKGKFLLLIYCQILLRVRWQWCCDWDGIRSDEKVFGVLHGWNPHCSTEVTRVTHRFRQNHGLINIKYLWLEIYFLADRTPEHALRITACLTSSFGRLALRPWHSAPLHWYIITSPTW